MVRFSELGWCLSAGASTQNRGDLLAVDFICFILTEQVSQKTDHSFLKCFIIYSFWSCF